MKLLYSIFLFLCCINSTAFSNENWLNAIHEDFVSSLPLPTPHGYITLYAWEPSPFAKDEQSVGHMALQIGDQYLSIWPSEKDRYAENHTMTRDLQELGTPEFLILKVSDCEWELLRQQVRKFIYDTEQQAYKFHVGNMSLKFPIGGDESITMTFDQHNNCQAKTSIKNINQHANQIQEKIKNQIYSKISEQGHFGARLGAGTGSGIGGCVGAALGTFLFPGVGTTIISAAGSAVGSGVGAGIGALSGLLDMANRKTTFQIPEEPKEKNRLKITYQANKKSPNSKTTCCIDAVEFCLRPISDLYTTIQKNARNKQTMTHHIQMSLAAKFRPLKMYGAMSDKDMKKNIQDLLQKIELSIIFHDNNSREAFQKAACCVVEDNIDKVFTVEDAEKMFFYMISKSASEGDIAENLQSVQDHVTVNKGRAALLFADPLTLPHGSLQHLASDLYHKKNELYVTSSYDDQIRSTKTNLF